MTKHIINGRQHENKISGKIAIRVSCKKGLNLSFSPAPWTSAEVAIIARSIIGQNHVSSNTGQHLKALLHRHWLNCASSFNDTITVPESLHSFTRYFVKVHVATAHNNPQYVFKRRLDELLGLVVSAWSKKKIKKNQNIVTENCVYSCS